MTPPITDSLLVEGESEVAAEPRVRVRAKKYELLPEHAPPAERLFNQPHEFDFFQAIRLLEQLQPLRREIGKQYSPDDEIVRFRAAMGTAFPASSISDLQTPADDASPPQMTVAFMGLTGPLGVLPAHYTELLVRLQRDYRTQEKRAIAEWFDLFNHRLISLFYRAWEKYRPWVAYQRGDYRLNTPDEFTQGIQALAGLASAERRDDPRLPPAYQLPRSLVRYAGLLAHRPRNVGNLKAILNDYFALPIEVLQFQGQWLALDREQQTQLGHTGRLGEDAVVGSRMWDRQSKVRVRIGPVGIQQFQQLLPEAHDEQASVPNLGEIAATIRLYLGGEIDFDVQLVLRGEEVPSTRVGGTQSNSSRLGWNTWLPCTTAQGDRDDATFGVLEVA